MFWEVITTFVEIIAEKLIAGHFFPSSWIGSNNGRQGPLALAIITNKLKTMMEKSDFIAKCSFFTHSVIRDEKGEHSNHAQSLSHRFTPATSNTKRYLKFLIICI